MRIHLPLIVCLIALLGFAPAPFPKKERAGNRDDLDAMQGLWQMTLYETSGSPISHNYKIRIKNNRWTFIQTNGNQESESSSYIYNLDTKVSPRAFEWKSAANATTGWVGSYRLEGRRLTIIFQSGTLQQIQTRPTDFGGKPSYRMSMEFIGRE